MTRFMFRLAALVALVLAALLLAGPVAAQETVPVEGHAEDLARLEGTWTGAYDCEATGRSGTLSFTLTPGARSALARLEMDPRPTPEVPEPAPIVLALHLVEVDSATVRGALAPYDDPEWEIGLETHFVGRIDGDRIEGVFDLLPTSIDTIPASGQWWATRQRATPPDF